MKKQIALIIVSVLASMSASAQNVNENYNNDMCRIHSYSSICEEGFGVIQPDFPDVPVIPDTPIIPDEPTLPDIPEADIPEVDVPEEEVPEGSLALQVLLLVNEERAKAGLSALTYDSLLSSAADIRAVEIKSLFSHTRPDGRSCFTVLDEVGYSYRKAGENIAYGQKSAKEVMSAWMNSDGHRANILGDFSHIGIGVYEKGGVIYWVQFFAK